VAISFLFLQELGYSNGKKEKDKNPEVHDEGDRKDLQKIAGKKNKKRNNSFIHTRPHLYHSSPPIIRGSYKSKIIFNSLVVSNCT
jgi:hypothetical protein